MKLWQCPDCGREVVGRERPEPTRYWQDHKCHFLDRAEIRKEQARPKGFNLLRKEDRE